MVKKAKNITVSQVLNNSAKNRRLGPVLVDFPHGPCLTHNLCDMKPGVDLNIVRWSEEKNVPSFRLSLTTPTLTYSNSSEQENDKYFTTYLAIRDKATGKTRLVETRHCLLKPEIEEPKTTNPILLSDYQADATKEERMEASRHLVKSFGQKKGQRLFENFDKFNVDRVEADAKVAKAAGAVNLDSLSQTPTKPKVDLAPPRDETASRAELIYRVEHFLTADETGELLRVAQNLLEEYNSPELVDQALGKREFSAIGAHFIKRFLNQAGDVGSVAAVTLYMEAIIKLTKLKPGDIAKGPHSALQKFLPLPIRKKVFQLFTFETGGKRIVTPELKDKAICYIIALALIVNSCKVELSLLTESVRVDQTKMKKLVLVTGAHLEVCNETREHTVILRKQLANFDVNYVGKKKRKN